MTQHNAEQAGLGNGEWPDELTRKQLREIAPLLDAIGEHGMARDARDLDDPGQWIARRPDGTIVANAGSRAMLEVALHLGKIKVKEVAIAHVPYAIDLKVTTL